MRGRRSTDQPLNMSLTLLRDQLDVCGPMQSPGVERDIGIDAYLRFECGGRSLEKIEGPPH